MNSGVGDHSGSPRRLLHVGAGVSQLPEWFQYPYIETRLDISPATNPDIVANMIDMGDIGEYDILVSLHSLEHLYPCEVPLALAEFHRVLSSDGGHALIAVPNLEGVEPTDEVLYDSPAGPVTGLDTIFGHSKYVGYGGIPYMEHHTGFIPRTLKKACLDAGFSRVIMPKVKALDLLVVAVK